MGGKCDESEKRKIKPRVPSTGFGADSAFDEMIKRRVGPPTSQPKQPSQAPAGNKR